MNKTLAILGAGDLGQQIAHYAINDNHYKEVVFFDDFTSKKEIKGYKVIGKKNDIPRAFKKGIFNEIIIGIGYNYLKQKEYIYNFLKQQKIPFGKIVHSTSWVDSTAKIEEGCIIYPTCNIDSNSVIHPNTVLNIGCTIAHDTIIGAHSFLSPRVAIAGFVKIKQKCIIGINSTIIDNINITSETQIGGGTVVVKNIEKSGLYVGNPQRFIR